MIVIHVMTQQNDDLNNRNTNWTIIMFLFSELEFYVHQLWLDSVKLTDCNYYIHYPFNYDAYANIMQIKHHVTLSHWYFLLSIL